MARLFYTGAETGGFEWNGANTVGSFEPITTTSYKRTGGYSYGFRSISALNPGYARQVFPENQTELYVRFALYLDNVASTQGNNRLWLFRDSNNATQFSLRYSTGTSTLEWRDGASTLLGLGNVLIPANTWVVVELHVVVGASGSLTMKVNGTTDAVYSGDTDYTNAGNVRSVYFGNVPLDGGATSAYVYYDDIAINNTDGDYENSWAGLGGVFYLEPTADGAQNDWTPSTGSDNYAMVDDIPSDGATTYNQALDSASIDLYEVDDCPEYIAEINVVQVAYRAALVTSGYNELTDLVRVGTVNYQGTEHTIVPITPSFTYYLGTPYYLNPGSGSAWGTAEVNALQVGVEITT